MAEQEEVVTADKSVVDKMDINGDGHISQREMELDLSLKEKSMKMLMRCAMPKEIWLGLLFLACWCTLSLLLGLKLLDMNMLPMSSGIWLPPIL